MSFNSKYSGQQVENLLDQVASGNAGGGGTTTEIDPIFSASPSAKITDGDIEEWNSKQDVIADLATIREGAAKGATAIQSHQDISGKLDKTEAASTYLSKTEASSTYLGKTAKAADATKADSATKATQDGNGNVIANTYANKVSVINHGTNDTTYTLTPNTLHVWDSVASLDLTFGAVDNTIYNEFMFQFSSGSNPTTLILPDSIKWVAEPAIEANKIYQCSIVNNIGVIASVDNV